MEPEKFCFYSDFSTGILVYAGSVLAMLYIGLDLASAAGATAAILWNVGPGLNLVSPTDNYAFLPGIGKWILLALMLMGRLEIFTVVVLLSPAYWRK